MPLISRRCIEDIKNRVNIYDVVSPVVSLRKSGRNFVGLSPFTNEKTPSFFILPEKSIFKCFSSGYAGDIFRFIELYEKLTFNEAIEAIANRFNLTLEYESGPSPPSQDRSLRKEILEIHQHAADFYHRNFMASDTLSESVRRYWSEERRFPLDTARDYKIGFAPPSEKSLPSVLQKRGYSLNALKKCGLFYFPDRATNLERFRPRFRGRLMIPIRDYRGQVIAFTARKLASTPEDDPSREAKYINSPETPLFKKSRVIFGLDHAREHIRENHPFLLVEGQLDALRCWQYSIDTAVAPQGTSITVDQLTLLKRYSNRIDCLLDGDSAGKKAALRLLPMAFATGHDVRILLLQEGSDPDSVLLEGGVKAIEELRKKAASAIEFAVSCLLPDEEPSPQMKAKVLTDLFEMILNCEQEVTQDEYLAEGAACLKVSLNSARNDFLRFKRRKSRKNRYGGTETEEAFQEENQSPRLTTADYELLLIVFHYRELAKSIAEVVDCEWIDTTFLHGKLLCKVLAEIREGLWEGRRSIDCLLENSEERNCAYSILAEEPAFDEPVLVANECIKSLFEKFLRERGRRIEDQIADLPTPSDDFPALQRKLFALRHLRQDTPRLPPLAATTQT